MRRLVNYARAIATVERDTTGPLTRVIVMKFKVRSLRQGVWFRALECQERGLLDAALSWLNSVRSDRLKQVLTRILVKLEKAMSSVLCRLRERGGPIAVRMSELAVRWQNRLAFNWRFDESFQVCLGAGVV